MLRHLSIFLFLIVPVCSLVFSGSQVLAQSDDLARLVHPDVADRMSLSDTQRSDIQKLLQAQGEAIVAAAEPAAKTAARKEFNDKILALLTEEQRGLLAQLEPSRKLMFQFREMKWDDVLHWFAEQQDLTLVMDRTPPGTFTYSDARTYSPNEGIDLLNSVLMTRNFALMRRDKMLVVIELSDSLPLELIPRIKQDDLPKRGRFELVSIVFPLGGRPIDAVLGEVKPYLSSFGRAVPLAQGSQLLVVENAGKMQTINELIMSVPVPKATPKPEPPPPPPQPVFASYPLGTLDAASVLSTIKTLIPSEQITIDPKTRVLSAFVVPSYQTAIKTAVDQMLASAGELQASESVAYQASKALPEDIKKQIAAIAPSALVMTSTDRILVTASAADQALIRAGLTGLDITPVVDRPTMKVFEIDPTMATIGEAAMKAFLPKAQVGANSAAGTLIVRGNDNDIQLATEIFEIWKRSQSSKSLQLKSFHLDRIADAKWLATVQKLVPTANAWLNPDGTELMMLATPAEIASIEKTMESLLALLPKLTARELKLYVLSKTQVARRTLLTSEMPTELSSMKLVDGTNKNELFVWGDPEQQTKFKTFLESLDQPGTMPAQGLPKTYPIQTSEYAIVSSLLTAEFPDAKITVDTEGKQLTVVADEAGHALLAQRLETIQEQLPKRPMLRLESYSVPNMTASALSTALTPLLTKARVNVDTAKDRLLITTDEANHKDIKELIEALSMEATADKQKVVVVYPIQHAVPTQIKTVVDQLVTGATTLADDKLKQLAVTGSIDTHATIKATIEQIDRPRSNDSGPKEIRSFDTKKTYASYLLPLLQKLWPDVELAVDATTNRILATGSKIELDRIGDALDRLISAPDGSPQTVKTYPVASGDLTSLSTILAQIAPQALISPDLTSRTLTVFASQEQHNRVSQAIEQVSKTAQSAKSPATYTVKPAQVTPVQTALTTLFPTVTFSSIPISGQIIAVATEEQQQRIAQVVELLTKKGASAEGALSDAQKEIRSFDTKKTYASYLLPLLQKLYPDMELAADTTTNRILATGAKEELDRLSESLGRLISAPEGVVQSVKTYPVPAGDLTSLTTMLGQIAPQAVLSPDLVSRTLTVYANEEQQERVSQAIEQIGKTAASAKLPATYTVKPTQVTAVQTALISLFPTASIASVPTSGQLIIVAPEDMQTKISQVVELMQSSGGAGEKTIRVFHLNPDQVDVTALMSTLTSTVPANIQLDPNTRNQTITAIGTKDELDLVAKKIEEIQQQLPPPEPTASVVYPLQYGNPIAAYTILSALLPKATVVYDTTGKSVAVTAKVGEHERVREVMKSFDAPRNETASTRVYRLKQPNAYGVATVLTAQFPTASIYGGRDDGTLIATANPEQHKRIEELVRELDVNAMEILTKVFAIERADATTLRAAIAASSAKVTATADLTTNSLIVTAPSDEMQRVEQVVREIDVSQGTAKSTKYYALLTAEALPLARALSDSFPKAKFSPDATNGGIYVTATGTEHESLTQLVEDINAQPGKVPTMKSFIMQYAGPDIVARAVIGALGSRTTAGVSFNRDTKTVFAIGTPQELATIEQMVRMMDNPGAKDSARRMEIFSLQGVDGRSLENAIENLFRDTSGAYVQYDNVNEQLLVTGSSSQITMVAEAIKKLAPPRRQLEIFSLESADPYSLKSAADALFEDEPNQTAPSISVDSNQQQLIVRATSEQLEAIKELMVRFGEQPERTGLLTRPQGAGGQGLGGQGLGGQGLGASVRNPSINPNTSSNASGRFRLVPIHRNPKVLIEDVQRLWPLIRSNPVQIIEPKDISKPSASTEPASKEPASKEPASTEPAQQVPQVPGNPTGASNILPKGESSKRSGARLVSTQDDLRDEAAQRGVAQEPSTRAGDEQTKLPGQAGSPGQTRSLEQNNSSDSSMPPVVVVAGDGQWTLASDDPEALIAMERLLATLLNPTMEPFATAGNYSVYILRHADAKQLRELLGELFRSGERRGFSGGIASGSSSSSASAEAFQRLKIVADTRTNALVIGGNRADRKIIEDLLGVFDSKDLIDRLQQITPMIISVKNASAETVSKLVEDVYRSQLRAGAGRDPLDIPEGVSTEVATVLQQINAQSSGPLLTMSVEEQSNLIVLRGPSDLTDEVKSFIDKIDQQSADAPARRVQVLKLESTNSKNLEKALKILNGK
jgi:type II secretory pathway component GspD/PulD (secretin)